MEMQSIWWKRCIMFVILSGICFKWCMYLDTRIGVVENIWTFVICNQDWRKKEYICNEEDDNGDEKDDDDDDNDNNGNVNAQ